MCNIWFSDVEGSLSIRFQAFFVLKTSVKYVLQIMCSENVVISHKEQYKFFNHKICFVIETNFISPTPFPLLPLLPGAVQLYKDIWTKR